jgi:hypothetical protein
MSRQAIVLTSAALVVGITAVSWYVTKQRQEVVQNAIETTAIPSGKIDELLTVVNTLRDVNFCGTIYRAKIVIIDGVDVIHRIAELATSGLIIKKNSGQNISKSVCLNIAQNVAVGEGTAIPSKEIKVSIEQKNYISDLGHTSYVVFLGAPGFQIDATTGDMYILSPIGDAPSLITEKLK